MDLEGLAPRDIDWALGHKAICRIESRRTEKEKKIRKK